jgi:3-oxoacyl-[acyl-carrier protein] reductase
MLSGKRVVITGANGGIGYAISELLLKNNAKLDLIYHKNKQNIERLINDYPDKIQDIDIHQVDLIKDKELEDVVSNITRTKSVDIFIHAPTYPTSHRAIMNTEWSEFQKNIELQSKAFFQITKFLVPHMKKQKMGRIISILTSYVVNEPPSGLSDYVVAKYSLLGLSKCMATELGKFGIRVNSISPSIVNTPLIDKLPSKFKEIVSSQIPLENKFAEPSDVAGLALFLCTESSNYISGENILLTGGYSMR